MGHNYFRVEHRGENQESVLVRKPKEEYVEERG